MDTTQPSFYVGIDWGRTQHQVCCLDHQGKILNEKSFDHQAQGLYDLVPWLLQITEAQPQQLKVALETSSGALVVALQSQQLTLYSINPKQSQRFRDRWSVAGAKDDRRDAFVLARALRTDEEVFLSGATADR